MTIEETIREPLIAHYVDEFGPAREDDNADQHAASARIWAEEQATIEIDTASHSQFLHMLSNAIEQRLSA